MKRAAYLLALLLLPAHLAGQVVRIPPYGTVEQLGACEDGQPRERGVTDGLAADDCTGGGGIYDVICYCLDGAWTAAGSGSGGEVSSVALSMPAEFSVAGSPVTSAGTLAVTKATQSANLVWAGPSSGAAAAPTFRPIVDADVPDDITAGTPNGTPDPCAAGSYARGVGALFAAVGCTADDDVPEAGDFGALALTGPVTSSGLATAIADDSVALGAKTTGGFAASASEGGPASSVATNSVALGTDTTGGYAGSSTEGGAATSAEAGDSATSFFPSGTIETARLGSGVADSTTYLRGDQAWAAVNAGIGGSTGSTDNAVLRADGTGGAAAQASTVYIADDGTVHFGGTTSSYASLYAPGSSSVLTCYNGDKSGFCIFNVERVRAFASGNVGANLQGNVGVELTAGNGVRWSSNSGDATQAKDFGIDRSAAGMGKFTDGGSGDGGWTAKRHRDVPQASPTVTCGDANTLGEEYTDTSGAKCWCNGTTWEVLGGAGSCA